METGASNSRPYNADLLKLLLHVFLEFVEFYQFFKLINLDGCQYDSFQPNSRLVLSLNRSRKLLLNTTDIFKATSVSGVVKCSWT